MKNLVVVLFVLLISLTVYAAGRQEPVVGGERYRTEMLHDKSSNAFPLPGSFTANTGETTSLIFETRTIEDMYVDVECDQNVTVSFVRMPDYYDQTWLGKESDTTAVTADTPEAVKYSEVACARMRFDIANASGTNATCLLAVRGSAFN